MTKEELEKKRLSLIYDLKQLNDGSASFDYSYTVLIEMLSKLSLENFNKEGTAIKYSLVDSYNGSYEIAERIFQLLGK